jgi:hypothetical protein
MNEATVQAHVRLLAAREGWRLWRNNVGVLFDSRGVPVRYGLANDSAAVNKLVKSGDLIGLRSVVITPDMVGKVIAQFVSLECKSQEWQFSPGDNRDRAQKAWADLVNESGGYAKFTQGDL